MIQIHHLTPESIQHLAVFVHLCEAFLGIEPHFELFRRLYSLVPLPSKDELGKVGCTSLELRSEDSRRYLQWPRIHIDPLRSSRWFYISNPSPELPKLYADPPVFFREWYFKSVVGSEFQTDELLDMISSLREKRVTTASIVRNWAQRRIQHCRKENILAFSMKVLKMNLVCLQK